MLCSLQIDVDVTKFKVQSFKSYKVCISIDDYTMDYMDSTKPVCTHLFSFEKYVPYNPDDEVDYATKEGEKEIFGTFRNRTVENRTGSSNKGSSQNLTLLVEVSKMYVNGWGALNASPLLFYRARKFLAQKIIRSSYPIYIYEDLRKGLESTNTRTTKIVS